MKFLSVCIPIDWHVKQAVPQAVVSTLVLISTGSMLVTAARHVIKAVFAGVPVMNFDPIATILAVPT